jgi:hypothetical protein
MRELKYFVVCSVDGFIAGEDGSTDAFVNDEDYFAELFEALPETCPAHLRRALGGEVRVCAPPDFAELLARVGVPLVPVGQLVRPMVTAATPPSAADLPPRAAELVAAQFDTVAAAVEECDAQVATGVMPAGVRL